MSSNVTREDIQNYYEAKQKYKSLLKEAADRLASQPDASKPGKLPPKDFVAPDPPRPYPNVFFSGRPVDDDDEEALSSKLASLGQTDKDAKDGRDYHAALADSLATLKLHTPVGREAQAARKKEIAEIEKLLLGPRFKET